MQPPKIKMTRHGNLAAEFDMDQLGFCKITPAMVRDVALDNWIISGPGMDERFMPSSMELETILSMAQHAVNSGQMIDFGYWPNDLMREVGHRGGRLYCEGALGHPFSSPYIFIHSWDDPKLPVSQAIERGEIEGGQMHTCAYLVNPFPKQGQLCIDFEAMTFEGLQIPRHGGRKCLGVGDRASLNAEESGKSGNYAAQVIPFALRFPELFNDPTYRLMASNRNQDDMLHSAAGNVLDPVMTALLILNTRGVQQQTVAASPKLNKARIKSNKPPIPPYRKVNSASYVTAIMNKVNRSYGPGTGTHASPVMHIRQGHWRHYQTGERSFIRDTLVNASPEMRNQWLSGKMQSGRSHYVIKDNE